MWILKNRYLLILGKGDKYRTVPMSEKVFDILLSRKEEFDNLKVKPLNNRVFWELNDVDAVYERFVTMRKILGINRTIHDIRHTFVTNYLRNGGSIVLLSKILGHSNIKTTQRYEHLVAADLHKNIDVFAQYG